MCEKIHATIGGPAFSFLLYENARCDFDQEGFLLGEVVTNEKTIITDNDQEVVNTERIVHINSVVPCPSMSYFYDNVGHINEDKIKDLVGDVNNKIVAYFKFSHLSSFKLTLRDRIILKQLSNVLSPNAPEHFLCCLLTNQFDNESEATHLFSQTFIRRRNNNFQPISMNIINLSDPRNHYITDSSYTSMLRNILTKLKIDVEKSQGFSAVCKIEKAIESRVEQLVVDLGKSESKMYNLEHEIWQLRNTLQQRQYNLNKSFSSNTSNSLENGRIVNDVSTTSSSVTEITSPITEVQKRRRVQTTPIGRTTRSSLSKSPEKKSEVRSYAQAVKK